MKPGDIRVSIEEGLIEYDDGLPRKLSAEVWLSVSISSPTSSENRSLLILPYGYRVESIRSVLRGSSTPSLTWNLRHGTDRSATGLDVLDGNATTTSTTTPETDSTLLYADIAAEEHLWFVSTAKSGTVDEISLVVVGRLA